MTEPPRIHPLGFFRTPPHDCGYLDDRQATTMFLDPRVRPDKRAYTQLSQHGFRRSGAHLYRPRCAGCDACVPIRVAIDDFTQNRRQRRCIKQNDDVTIRVVDSAFNDEHFALYERYIATRHPAGGMEDPDPKSYMDFLTASWAETSFIELKLEHRLIAVAVIDRLDDGLSAVYTFFDPDHAKRSLGRFAILSEITLGKRLGLRWLYLGYWIESCRKMAYKSEFQPHQKFVEGVWRDA